MKTQLLVAGLIAITAATTASADVWSDLYEAESKPATSYTVPGSVSEGKSGFRDGVLSSALLAKDQMNQEREGSWKVRLNTVRYSAMDGRSLFKDQILSSAVPATPDTAEFARFETTEE